MKMKKAILLPILAALASCEGNSDSSASETVECNNGVNLPVDLVGSWETEFTRNGEQGLKGVTIGDNCTFQQYEIGGKAVMEEWHSSDLLKSGIEYLFSINPGQEISSVTDEEMYLVGDIANAVISNNTTKEEVRSWEISTIGSYISYEISSNDELKLFADGYSFTFVKRNN